MQHDYSSKRLKTSPGAQTITHSALKFSGYVSNMAQSRRNANVVLH